MLEQILAVFGEGEGGVHLGQVTKSVCCGATYAVCIYFVFMQQPHSQNGF